MSGSDSEVGLRRCRVRFTLDTRHHRPRMLLPGMREQDMGVYGLVRCESPNPRLSLHGSRVVAKRSRP